MVTVPPAVVMVPRLVQADLPGVDDHVAQVGAGHWVERAAARDEAEFGVRYRAVDLLGREAVLGVPVLAVHPEDRQRAVGPPHVHQFTLAEQAHTPFG